MKFIFIVPGDGNNFYCQNCLRDKALIKSLREIGHDAMLLPVYLPIEGDDADIAGDNPVFYGAVNIYLKQFPFLRKLPRWIKRFLDSDFILRFAGKKAGSTRAKGLSELTLSLLKGDKGNQSEELKRMIDWILEQEKPDAIIFSNALLSGFAQEIKKRSAAKIICFYQDEHHWTDILPESEASLIWKQIEKNAQYIDLHLPVSHYYKEVIEKKMENISLSVLYPGIEILEEPLKDTPEPPVLGYLSRFTSSLGLEILIDAFLELKKEHAFKDLKLFAIGGKTNDDDAFLRKLRKKTKQYQKDVIFSSYFDREARTSFYKQITLLVIPVLKGEAFALHQLEALSYGVPVVGPNRGVLSEVNTMTEGGVIYNAQDEKELAKSLRKLLQNRNLLENLGEIGARNVRKLFPIERMRNNFLELFFSLIA